MPTVFITGANRGIGLELLRQYVDDGWKVYATCRREEQTAELSSVFPAVTLFQLELTDLNAIAALGRHLENDSFDVFIANAGVLSGRGMRPELVDRETWMHLYEVNTVAPIACAAAFVRQVARSNERKLLAMSSYVGSIESNVEGGHYPYRASKAALNAVWKSFSIDHPEVIAAVLSPGHVRTRMTNFEAAFSTEEAATNVRSVIRQLTQADSGHLIHYDGTRLPW